VEPGLPPDFEAQLARTEDDLPILIETGASLSEGVSIGIAYDASLDDPVKRWSQCLGQVGACYDEEDTAACISNVTRCVSDDGGTGCCPPTCLNDFAARIAAGEDEDTVVDDVFLEGDCVNGVREQFAAAGVTP